MGAFREEKGPQAGVSRGGRASKGGWGGETVDVGRKPGESGISFETGEEILSRREWSAVSNAAEGWR